MIPYSRFEAAIPKFGKNEVFLIVMYSVIVSTMSLAVPIAAQALVNMVSFGMIRQPIIVLAFLVMIMLTGAAFFRVLHIVLIENIKQHLFVHNSLYMAKLIPKWSPTVFDEYRGTEMMNRFFDIFTIQRSLAGLLVSGVGVVLQIFLGMCLLAVYHPYLLLFDIIFLFAIVLVIWLPWRSALKAALMESDAKYMVAGWLEEIARIFLLFKFSNNAEYAYNVADEKVSYYIKARKKHFGALMQHVIGSQIIQVISSSSLLLLGGILVVKNQLTLGQLIAAEIVVTGMGASIAKFASYLENMYSLLAASNKVGFLLELPAEEIASKNNPIVFKSAPSVKVKHIDFHSSNNYHILNDINFNIEPGGRCVIHGDRGSGKSLLTEIILGLKTPTKGNVFYNEIPLVEYSLPDFRSQVAYIKGIQFYDGSIIENLCMNNEIGLDKIRDILNKFDLSHVISRLELGVYTKLHGNHQLLSSIELQKLMLVRAAIARPYLLVIDEMLDLLPLNALNTVIDAIFSEEYNWTVIATTRRQDVTQRFPQRIFL